MLGKATASVMMPNMKLQYESNELEQAVIALCQDVQQAGGQAYAVGGCIRDAAFSHISKDIDIEVLHIQPQQLQDLLTRRFEVDLVGQSFGVLKLRHLPIDVAIPRRESKSGLGHRAFEIMSDPDMSAKEAASRRDFTINAIALNPLTGQLVDPFNGMQDLHHRILRHTTEKFAEDPLRVLRGAQFIARFQLTAAPETIRICRQIEPENLPAERIFDEWSKLILKGIRPSAGLQFLRQCNWIRYYPELEALIGCPQNPKWHPEGDVWQHTLLAMNAFAAERTGDPHEDLVVGLAVLCHDFGKPLTTSGSGMAIHAHNHEMAGKRPTETFLRRMTNQDDLIKEVLQLVVHHMRPLQLWKNRASDSAVRRLAHQVKRIDRLCRVNRADQHSRMDTGSPDEETSDRWLLQQSERLSIHNRAPQPLVMGRHLIELGLEPSPAFSTILNECYEAQIEGRFFTEAEGIALARTLIAPS